MNKQINQDNFFSQLHQQIIEYISSSGANILGKKSTNTEILELDILLSKYISDYKLEQLN
jgi:hypothetical protein